MTSRLARMHEFNFATLQDSLAARDSSEAPVEQKRALGVGGWIAAVALTLGAIGLAAGAALEYFNPPALVPGPTATTLQPGAWQLDPELALARGIQAESALVAQQPPPPVPVAALALEPAPAPAAPTSNTDNPY